MSAIAPQTQSSPSNRSPVSGRAEAAYQRPGRGMGYAQGAASLVPLSNTYASQMAALRPLQLKGAGRGGDVHAAAARGTAGSGGALPYADRVQAAFGKHDIGGIRSHTGGQASAACQNIGAKAYASDGAVAFATASPDLHTVAHEAAHVIQQADGVALKGGVGAAGDAYEQHADRVADAVVAGNSAEALLDRGPRGAGSGRAVQLKPLATGGIKANKGGITVTAQFPAFKKLSYVSIGNTTITINAVPTSKTSVETHKEGTHVSGGVETSGGDAGAKSNAKTGQAEGESVDGNPKVKAELKHRWGKSPAFTDVMGEVGPGGGSVGITAGGEWKNLSLSAKFNLLSMGGDGKDIKFLTTTTTGKVYGIINVGGVNFKVTASISVDIKPNTTAVARYLIKKGLIASMRHLGKGMGKVGALPFVFIEGGYETLKAAYMNIRASKELPAFVNKTNAIAREAGMGFVQGVLGNPSGLGGMSGLAWFNKAYAVTKADHPDITKAQFGAALNEYTAGAVGWKEKAQAQVTQQVRTIMYNQFMANPPSWANYSTNKDLKEILFRGETPPDTGAGVQIDLPTIVDRSKSKKKEKTDDVEFEEQAIGPQGGHCPADIRWAVKHRVKNWQTSGTIPYQGNTFTFKYDPSQGGVLVYGGPNAEMSSFVKTPAPGK